MTNHVFIFGGPRNGSWVYMYSRKYLDSNLWSGTEHLDWQGNNLRTFDNGQTHQAVSFRLPNDELSKQMIFSDGSMPGSAFEIMCLQEPYNFLYNMDILNATGKKLIAKGYEHSRGLTETVPHEKVFIHRPLVDQWKSYALCHVLKQWQWEKDDQIPDNISMDGINKKELSDGFIKRMFSVFGFYETCKNQENFTRLDYDEVLQMENDCPLLPTPKIDLPQSVQDFIHDTAGLRQKFVIDEHRPPQSILEVEEELF